MTNEEFGKQLKARILLKKLEIEGKYFAQMGQTTDIQFMTIESIYELIDRCVAINDIDLLPPLLQTKDTEA